MHGVSSLSRLAHKDTHVIPEDGAPPVQQITGQLQVDREVSQALHSLAACQASVKGGATRHEHHTPAAPDGAQVISQASQCDAALLVWVNYLIRKNAYHLRECGHGVIMFCNASSATRRDCDWYMCESSNNLLVKQQLNNVCCLVCRTHTVFPDAGD